MGQSNSVDLLRYSTNNLVGGDNIVIYAGPPKHASTYALRKPAPGEDDSGPNSLKLVGVVQQLNIQSGRPQKQINEIGSNAKYLLSSRGQKQMTLARIVTTEGSVLYALYRYMVESNIDADGNSNLHKPEGKIWLSMSHPLFRKPVGLMFVLGYYSEDNNFNPLEMKYHEDVVVASVGTQITEGDVGIADNLSLVWSNTIKVM